ncbi:MAG: LysM peptidoglycan-binding domain-containing protein [Spirochaetia bacterium]|nr:LysM peptidoglycan-binding domain-containing protein [Spirochaetia bacterium]
MIRKCCLCMLASLCIAVPLISATEAEGAFHISAVSTEGSSSALSETPSSSSAAHTPLASAPTSQAAPDSASIVPPEAPEELPSSPLEESQEPIDLSQLVPEELSLEEHAKSLQYDIPMPWGHELFEKYRQYYLSDRGRKILLSTMEKAAPFMDYIESKVAEYGAPQELAFLPVIESAFSPFAVSRSGATGIWQFMKNSINGYGLTITEWVDERRDFMKSTDAAIKKLIDNYNDLKDWPLAIAAYNAGLGALRRAVNAAGGDTDFWNIYDKGLVSKQALDYVPKFLAVASILRYPDLYGLALPPRQLKWEAIPLDRQVDLKLLASKAEIPLDTLKLGNAELHYTITPPDDSHFLKVPAEKSDQVKAILSDPNAPLVRYDIYKVKQGDTLTAISRHYGVSISMIAKVNPGLNPDRLKIGQTLMIPLSLQPLNPSMSSNASSGSASAQSTSHTVQKGDTLYGIARRYDTTAQKIASLNGISVNSVLRIGQKLKVPTQP